MCRQLKPTHLTPHSVETTLFETTTFETCSFETTFTWDVLILDRIHLRPHLFQTTFLWDHIHWDQNHLRHTFIWDHIHCRPHSFYVTLKWSCFHLLWITFLWSTFHFFAGDLKFCKVTLHLKFCKATPFRVQRWLMLGCKCTRTLKHRRGQKTLHKNLIHSKSKQLHFNVA